MFCMMMYICIVFTNNISVQINFLLIITNSQNMYVFDMLLVLQYLTPFEHICLSFLVV